MIHSNYWVHTSRRAVGKRNPAPAVPMLVSIGELSNEKRP
jgi:hypothetical protein